MSEQSAVEQSERCFVCPDPTGAEAPCSRIHQQNHLGLEIETGAYQRDYCPVAAAIQCTPYGRWLPFREHRLTELAGESGVPGRLSGASFETAKPTAAIERCRQYLENDLPSGGSLTLLGPPGAGKSFALVATLRQFNSRRRRHGRFWYMPALIGALLDPHERDSTLRNAKDTGLLILDDLGTEYCKEGGFAEACLEEIVWHREADEMPTLFSSNLTVDQLRARLSDRILDRLAGEWGSIFAVGGPSLRRTQ